MISHWRSLLNGAVYCGLLAMAFARVDASAKDRFAGAEISSPDFFPILPWDPYHGWGQPRIERKTFGLDSIAQCNFNMAGFVLPRDLALCKKFGLGAIMLSIDPDFTNVQYIYSWKNLSDAAIDRRVKSMVGAAGSNPSIVGYFITDEPGVADFPALGKAVAAVKRYAPGKLAYINLFPNYATLGAPDTSQLGTSSYTEYLERFVAEVKPQCISYDNYMVQYSMDMRDRAGAANYYYNLLEVRRVGLEHHLPYLNIVASSQLLPDKAIPSPANLLFQAYTTLAAGYRGVTWYTYFGDGYPYAPLAKSGEKTATWGALQDVNHQVAMLAPIMSHLKSTGVFFTQPLPADGLPLLPGRMIASVSSATPMMVGEFEDEHGGRYAMIVNLNLEHSTRIIVKTARPGEILAVDGRPKQFTAQSGLWLTAGQGALFRRQ